MKNTLRAVWMFIIVMIPAGVVFALQDGDADAAAAAGDALKSFDWNNLWQMALAGALGTALVGAGKSGNFNPKDWSIPKMVQKGIVGVVIGVFASLNGIDLDSAKVVFAEGDGLGVATLLTFGLDYLFRMVWKGAAISVKKAADSFKKAGENPTPPPAQP